MHTKPETHEDILRLWTGPKHLVEMADDIGVPKLRARMWRDRNSIPPQYWMQVIEAVRRRFDIALTVDDFARAAARAHCNPKTDDTGRATEAA